MSTALLEKTSVTAESNRTPIPVMQSRKYWTTAYYIFPRCNIAMERESMAYCDRRDQRLSWKNYGKMEMISK